VAKRQKQPQEAAAPGIRDRVKELRRVRARDLVPNPSNWRTHPEGQRAALQGILAEVGYADALLARELPDGSLMLIDGHMRAETTPDQEVPVLVLDVTEAEANKLLLSVDPIAALAETSSAALADLLHSVQTGNEGLAAMYEQLATDVGLVPDEAPKVLGLDVRPPPRMAWALIGIPVVRYGEIAQQLERIGQLEGVTLLTVANDAHYEN
jgi:hypothetical protein